MGPLEVRGNVLAAFDERAGGTWMGLNVKTGCVVSLTNVRDLLTPAGAVSRGQLVLRALAGELPPLASSGPIDLGCSLAGFNLLVADPAAPHDLVYLHNRQFMIPPDAPSLPSEVVFSRTRVEAVPPSASSALAHCPLTGDVHCVSNGGMDGFTWPKVAALADAARRAIASSASSSSESAATSAAADHEGETGLSGSTDDVDLDLEAAARLVRRVGPHMLRTRVVSEAWEASVRSSDLVWSDERSLAESLLQRGVFVAGSPGAPSVLVTRALTVAMQTDSHAIYCYKALDALQAPRLRATAEAVPGAGTLSSLVETVVATIAEPIAGAAAAVVAEILADGGVVAAAEINAGSNRGVEWPAGVEDVSDRFNRLVGPTWPDVAEGGLTAQEAGRGISSSRGAGEHDSDEGAQLVRQVWALPWTAVRVALPSAALPSSSLSLCARA